MLPLNWWFTGALLDEDDPLISLVLLLGRMFLEVISKLFFFALDIRTLINGWLQPFPAFIAGFSYLF
jgi:hypothetical protein